MPGPLAAPLIGAVGSLLGGIFGKSKTKNEYVVPDYAKIRRDAEAAGFNPLTALTSAPGSVVQTTSGGYMGQAIANAGLLLADGVAAKRQSELDALKDANKKLADKVQNMTLRPKVGGIYSGNVSTPGIRQALGVPDAKTSRSSIPLVDSRSGSAPADPGDYRPLVDTSDADPRRTVDNAKVTTSSGFMVVDSPYVPFPLYFPTADGDEPLQWYDYPSLIVPAVGSAIKEYGPRLIRDFGKTPPKPAYKPTRQLLPAEMARSAEHGVYRAGSPELAAAKKRQRDAYVKKSGVPSFYFSPAMVPRMQLGR